MHSNFHVAIAKRSLPSLLSVQAELKLQDQVQPRHIILQRRGVAQKGVHVLSPGLMRVEGVLFSPQIILTADGWMDPLPYEEEVLLYAQCSTHASTTRHEFQPVHVLKRSPKEGWALLQSDAPISCAQQSSLPSLNVSELYEGQQLLSMEPPPKRMTSLLVSGRGTGVLAYFQLVTGSLSIGSPLFDTQGKFVTLSAGFTRSTLDSLIGPHWTPVLPKEAIEHALREAKLLIRSHRQ